MINRTQKLILELLAEHEELSPVKIEEQLTARGRSICYDTLMRNLGKMVKRGQLLVTRYADDKLYCDDRRHWTNHYRLKTG